MEKIHYNVNGIANENMKTQVRNAVEKMEGVDMVCVDRGRGRVEVDYNTPASPETIKESIEKTGHRVEDQTQSYLNYTSYYNCNHRI